MERMGALIERLTEQYQQKEGVDNMLATVQLLAAELQKEKAAVLQKGKKISVILPVSFRREEVVEETVYVPKKPEPVAEIKPVEIKPVEVKASPIPSPPLPAPEPPKIKQPVYDPVKETPTLYHQQKPAGELNEVMGSRQESFNERLKTSAAELGSVLQAAPVRDLKKAIGINDRYVFLNELFRGDEVMYERSIKTINAYSNLAEAEFWIKRELKLKQGWNEDSEAVKHFDQLVRRRFS